MSGSDYHLRNVDRQRDLFAVYNVRGERVSIVTSAMRANEAKLRLEAKQCRKLRKCLGCRKLFVSDDAGNRQCGWCRRRADEGLDEPYSLLCE